MSRNGLSAPAEGREQHAADEDATRGDLRARIDLLAEENRRLRAEYVRARQSQYRHTAAALGVVGLVAVGAGAFIPAVREPLLILGAIGVFGGVLTYYLTPERFVAASVGGAVYGALADNEAAMVAELGVSDHRVYVPGDDADRPARLYIPQHAEYSVPTPADLDATFIVTDEPDARGLGFVPTGGRLYREFERSTTGGVAQEPGPLVDQLGDALVEVFELVDSVDTDVDVGDGRATVRVTDPVLDAPERIDDPATSVVAVGLAVGLDTPVSVDSSTTADGFIVTYTWEPDSTAGDRSPDAEEPTAGA